MSKPTIRDKDGDEIVIKSIKSGMLNYEYKKYNSHYIHSSELLKVLAPDTTLGDIAAALKPKPPRRKREFTPGPWNIIAAQAGENNQSVIEYAPLMYELLDMIDRVHWAGAGIECEQLHHLQVVTEKVYKVLDAIDNREPSAPLWKEIVGDE